MRFTKRTTLLGAGLLVAAAATAGGGIAAAGGLDDENEQPLKGETYDRAAAAALAYTGGGTVTEAETGDDGAAYDVEVRKADGSTVEVRLDSAFTAIGTEIDDDADGEGEDDD